MGNFAGTPSLGQLSADAAEDAFPSGMNVVFADYSLFDESSQDRLLSNDAVCIDVDASLATQTLPQTLRWIAKANASRKQVFAVGSRENLLRSEAILKSDVTLIEKTDGLSGLSGAELARAVGVQLDELYSPFERTQSGFRARMDSDMIYNDDLPEEIDSEIDEQYCTPLLTLKERRQLIDSMNGLDEQSEEEDEEGMVEVEEIAANTGHPKFRPVAAKAAHDDAEPWHESSGAPAAAMF
jgi:hypothetical protein